MSSDEEHSGIWTGQKDEIRSCVAFTKASVVIGDETLIANKIISLSRLT
jgi:hypothetical protein